MTVQWDSPPSHPSKKGWFSHRLPLLTLRQSYELSQVRLQEIDLSSATSRFKKEQNLVLLLDGCSSVNMNDSNNTTTLLFSLFPSCFSLPDLECGPTVVIIGDTASKGWTILGYPLLIACMGICVLCLVHESGHSRTSVVYMLSLIHI